MKIDYKFNKKGAVLVACTFGPDSMALLDILQKDGIKPVVVAIEYRSDFSDDYATLGLYCEQKGLKYRLEKAPEYKEEYGNYAQWARKTRYDFFAKVYEEEHATALLFPHSQDDLLEDYLYQKNHQKDASVRGFAPVSIENKMVIVRPLLKYSLEDLIEYAEENRLPFSRNILNFEMNSSKSHYYREVAAMSEIDRDNLIREMESVHDESLKMAKEFQEAIDEGEELDIRALISLSPDEFASTLFRFISNANDEVDVTPDLLAKIRAFCLSSAPNDSMFLAGDTYLMKEYDILLIGKRFDELPYTYILEKPGVLDTPNFLLDFSGGAEDRGIHDEDYPLVVRSALPYDTYVVHGYLESVHRLYSIWKMPMRLRYVWPIFVNKNGKIIYVPRYRQNFSEEHTSILRMKLKDDEH